MVFGFLSFAGFEAAATLGEEATHPTRDIPRAILGTAIFGGIYFVVVTAVEMMGFGTSKGVDGVRQLPLAARRPRHQLRRGVGRQHHHPGHHHQRLRLLPGLHGGRVPADVRAGPGRRRRAAAWAGRPDRDPAARPPRDRRPSRSRSSSICLAAFHANAEDSFAWSGTIGTLILLVAYVLATIGCIMLVFVRRKLPVPMWQVVVPLAALVVLGYTLYRNVIPYPSSGPGRWFPVVAGGWLVVALVAVIVAPGFARRLGAALTASEGIGGTRAIDRRRVHAAPGRGRRGDQSPRA